MQETVEILYDTDWIRLREQFPRTWDGRSPSTAQPRSDAILVIVRDSLTICVLYSGPPTDIVSQ